MPLSTRFEELVTNLRLKEALWHLERANAWTDYEATEWELADWYARIMNLVQDTGNMVSAMLALTNNSLQKIPSAGELLQQRDNAVRESWMLQTGKTTGEDTDTYEKSVASLLELSRLKNLRKNAMALLEGKWIHASDVLKSVNSLPETIEIKGEVITLSKNVILQHLSTKTSFRGSSLGTVQEKLPMAA